MGISKSDKIKEIVEDLDFVDSRIVLDLLSQWLQDGGYEDASKAIDCEFDL